MEERGVIGEELFAPRACAMRADDHGGEAELQLGDRPRSATRRSRSRPARRLNLCPLARLRRREGESEVRATRPHPAVEVGDESEAWWCVNPTVTGRLTRA
jgi:hypothetical protein